MAKGFANAVNAVIKQANANAARCVCIWAALALREEGYGKNRIKRVLDNIIKYSKQSCGKTDIEEQVKHIENVTGLKIVWTSDMEVSVEDVEDWDDYDTEYDSDCDTENKEKENENE